MERRGRAPHRWPAGAARAALRVRRRAHRRAGARHPAGRLGARRSYGSTRRTATPLTSTPSSRSSASTPW